MELFKSVRHMMAEGKFIQAERTLMDYSLQNEEELPIEFFQILFEVRRLKGSEFPFSELNTYFDKLKSKNKNDEIKDLLNWWVSNNPSFESADLYQWKLLLAEDEGNLKNLESVLKNFGMFLLNHKYWAHIEIYKTYFSKYFKNNYDLVFVIILYQIQTNKFQDLEKILYQFTEDQIVKAKRTAKIEDDIDLMLTLLNQVESKGFLEVWKSFFAFQLTQNFADVEIKKFIECFIYFEDFSLQLVLLRKLHQWDEVELAQEMAETIKFAENYDFVLIEKYFAHDLKQYFIKKKEVKVEPLKSLLTEADLRPDNRFKKDSSIVEEESHVLTDDEALIIAGFKFQKFSVSQGLDLIVSMLQMNFPIAAREIGMELRKDSLSKEEKLKLNYLFLQIFHNLKDFRAGLDIALESLGITESPEDILAFTYAEADFYYHLGQKQKAKSIYQSIYKLVGNYRMTRERIKEIDEA